MGDGNLAIQRFHLWYQWSKASGNLKSSDFTSLTIFIVGGGVNGKECKPIVKIDNIRAVPYK
ncbi:glycan-binding surface protein [Segatella baroniae]|uniref:glycan-binding surface protein n=1 Tax=Segatella baroniae TaxID=305719 RepID=UPI00357122B0